MQRWLLVSNCQTTGLANSIHLLTNEVEVAAADIWTYSANLEGNNTALAGYDRVVAFPDLKTWPGVDLSRARTVTILPHLHFSAYHPDLTYLIHEGAAFKGPLEDYHSVIAYAAHRKGLTVEQALKLYNGRFYDRCGYLDHWEPQRDAAIHHFGSFGIDISRGIRRWGRGGAFMHSVNHPKVHVLFDLARILLEANGIRTHASAVLPHDNLAYGPAFPVYPEIGDRLGSRGSYQFKRGMAYRNFGLEEFVRESFARYDQFGREALSIPDYNQPLLDRVAANI